MPLRAVADSQALAAKLAPDLKGIDPTTPVDVIVQFDRSTSPTDLTTEGATNKIDMPLVNAQLVTIAAGNLGNLASHPGVAYVSPNRQVKGASAADNLATSVNADLALAQGYDGTGVGVAVIDSGVTSVQ